MTTPDTPDTPAVVPYVSVDERRLNTAQKIAEALPGAHVRNMPALGFANVSWRAPDGGFVVVTVSTTPVSDTTIDVEIKHIGTESLTTALAAIAAERVAARADEPCIPLVDSSPTYAR